MLAEIPTKDKKTWFSFSNLSTVLLIGLAVSMFVFPDVKSVLLRGLMAVGLFQPEMPAVKHSAASTQNVIFKDASGRSISTGDLKGKVVFINFWATWCPPCRAEMPGINKLYNNYKSKPDLVFIMADADGKPEAALAYMKKKGFELPVHTIASDIPDTMFSGSLPTTVILNKSGQIVYRGVGAADYGNQKVADFLDHLLSGGQSK
ncbi:TlpA family protein disulfide reductase [Pedobacter deserti]|uniref:TlpA family protein disulfide reductase n=1 Tax=Pedobacter deserti TaxID=2817382 RepID=UPI00210A41AE|nr:TlpA disulfide reductase family protein [Pedobacter sp. SYSU D00382]